MSSQAPSVYIRPLTANDAPAMLDLRVRNQAFLQPFEPIRPASFFTLEGQREQLASAERDFAAGTAYAFGVFLREGDELIGRVNLTNIVRGAWQNATIGYFLDQSCGGRGCMTQAVRQVLDFAFAKAELHRVQAAVMPRNTASIRVLEKTGFRREGLSLRYLQINGVWEDHLIFAITREEWT
jgi:ribosomal-protein-alanine N-acetyltransferase